jgi:glycosyltransferase involved in cell wall biosynthesis
MHIIATANASWNLFNFRRGVLAAILADGHTVTAVAPDDAYSDRLIELGCHFLPLEIDSKGLSPLRDLALLASFRRTFQRASPDAVIGYTIKNNIYGALAARSLGIPFLPNVSGLGTAFASNDWLQLLVTGLHQLAFRKTPAVFFQNEADRELFIKLRIVDQTTARILPGSGVDLGHFQHVRRPARSEVKFLFVGRMLWDKGVGEFVEAARTVRKDHAETKFELVGPAAVKSRGAIDPATIGLWTRDGWLTHAGEVEDVRPYIAGADCLVLPSYYPEGTPRVLLEACAMGCPIITTDMPGCRSAVEDGVTGFLCNPRDPDDLAAQMRRVIALGGAGRAEMGQKARAKMEREYDQALVINAYLRELTALRGSSRRAEEPEPGPVLDTAPGPVAPER